MERSIGHLSFSDKHEYVLVNGSVYRAPLCAPIMPDGLRGGLRFEGSLAWWKQYGNQQLVVVYA